MKTARDCSWSFWWRNWGIKQATLIWRKVLRPFGWLFRYEDFLTFRWIFLLSNCMSCIGKEIQQWCYWEGAVPEMSWFASNKYESYIDAVNVGEAWKYFKTGRVGFFKAWYAYIFNLLYHIKESLFHMFYTVWSLLLRLLETHFSFHLICFTWKWLLSREGLWERFIYNMKAENLRLAMKYLFV